MLRPLWRLAPLALLALSSGCDSTGAASQQAFEDQAYFTAPSGITRTTREGTVTSTDPDDWRIGPAFGTRVQVQTVPVPNPTGPRATVTLLMYTDGVPGGLALYRIDRLGNLRLVASEPSAQQTGFYPFTFFGSEVSSDGAPGLYRLVLLDGRDRVVTYGDVELVP